MRLVTVSNTTAIWRAPRPPGLDLSFHSVMPASGTGSMGAAPSPFYGRMQVRQQGRGQSWADLIAASTPDIGAASA